MKVINYDTDTDIFYSSLKFPYLKDSLTTKVTQFAVRTYSTSNHLYNAFT